MTKWQNCAHAAMTARNSDQSEAGDESRNRVKTGAVTAAVWRDATRGQPMGSIASRMMLSVIDDRPTITR